MQPLGAFQEWDHKLFTLVAVAIHTIFDHPSAGGSRKIALRLIPIAGRLDASAGEHTQNAPVVIIMRRKWDRYWVNVGTLLFRGGVCHGQKACRPIRVHFCDLATLWIGGLIVCVRGCKRNDGVLEADKASLVGKRQYRYGHPTWPPPNNPSR